MSDAKSKQALKRPRIAFESSSEGYAGSHTKGQELMVIGAEPSSATGTGVTTVPPSVPRAYERLSLTINPEYIQSLKAVNTLGFERLPTQRSPTPRYYELNLDSFKDSISLIMSNYLKIKLTEHGQLSDGQITSEVNSRTPLIVNACVAALYSKLRTIHKSFGTYATRFNTPASYGKDIELPLPFADAIQNIGVFTPTGLTTHYLCIPVYPEGVQNEGRTTQMWNSYAYEAYVPILKSLGIPVKSVDTRLKPGTAWWTLKPLLVEHHYDFQCIFPPSNYSEHSAVLAAMFLVVDRDLNPVRLINELTDDADYPVILREVAAGFQLRTFSALCHCPSEEWNQYLLID